MENGYDFDVWLI